jgi:hypothetical protein
VKVRCEHGNEPWGAIKFWETYEQLNDWWILKNGKASWSQLVG